MNSFLLLDSAITFATRAHSGVYRKGTQTPYILHPLEAAAIVATMTDDVEIMAAAVLHDTVEDTDTTLVDIQQKFGERIAKLVAAESEDKQNDRPAAETWRERKQATIDYLNTTATLDEKMITLGDKLSNIRAMHRDYQAFGDSLWERFNQKDKAEHGWYYKAISDALSDLKAFPVFQEYRLLVDEVFC